MRAEPVLVEPPPTLHRVERIAPTLSFSRTNAVDAALDLAGNRFDVPGAGVLYAATTAAGAFAETLANSPTGSMRKPIPTALPGSAASGTFRGSATSSAGQSSTERRSDPEHPQRRAVAELFRLAIL